MRRGDRPDDGGLLVELYRALRHLASRVAWHPLYRDDAQLARTTLARARGRVEELEMVRKVPMNGVRGAEH